MAPQGLKLMCLGLFIINHWHPVQYLPLLTINESLGLKVEVACHHLEFVPLCHSTTTVYYHGNFGTLHHFCAIPIPSEPVLSRP